MPVVYRRLCTAALALLLGVGVRGVSAQAASGVKTASATATAAKAASLTATTTKAGTVADADKLDINTASPAQLKALKGIGDAYTKRIIDGRPYTAKNQLTTRGILPTGTYEGIKDQIVARNAKK